MATQKSQLNINMCGTFTIMWMVFMVLDSFFPDVPMFSTISHISVVAAITSFVFAVVKGEAVK